MTIELNDDERAALSDAIDLARNDQEHYLDFGNPEVDYAAEWREVAGEKAKLWATLARVSAKLGFRPAAEVALSEAFAEEAKQERDERCACQHCGLPIEVSEPSTELDGDHYHDKCAALHSEGEKQND